MISAGKFRLLVIYADTNELCPLILDPTSNSCSVEMVSWLLSGFHLSITPTWPIPSMTVSPLKNWFCFKYVLNLGKWLSNTTLAADSAATILPGVLPKPISSSGRINSIYALAPPIWPLDAVIVHNLYPYSFELYPLPVLPRPTLTFSNKNFSPTANPPFEKSAALLNVLSKNNLTVLGNPVDVPAPVRLYVRSLIPIPFGFPTGTILGSTL